MKTPVFLDALDIDAVRNGDPAATADALQALVSAYNAQAQALANRIGSWQAVPYNAADFHSANLTPANIVGTWTLPSADYAVAFEYYRIDDVLLVQGIFATTAVSNTVDYLTVKIPGGFKCRGRSQGFMRYVELDGTPEADLGVAETDATAFPDASDLIAFSKPGLGAQWAAGATTTIFFSISIHIAPTSGN